MPVTKNVLESKCKDEDLQKLEILSFFKAFPSIVFQKYMVSMMLVNVA